MKLLALVAMIFALLVAVAPAFAGQAHDAKQHPPKQCGVYYKYNC
jgi:hypothetical protein